MMGSDYPFDMGSADPVGAIADAGLDEVTRAALESGSAARFLSGRALDTELAAGRSRGVLHGVPIALKDLCHVRGLPTSCGTKTAEYFTPERECTAASRLRSAGAVILGKRKLT